MFKNTLDAGMQSFHSTKEVSKEAGTRMAKLLVGSFHSTKEVSKVPACGSCARLFRWFPFH